MECIVPREKLISEIGSTLTQGLFYEFRHQTTQTTKAPYTLKDYDWKGCLSMYIIYMAAESEYEAAMKLLGSWSHWKRLCECAWFKPHLESWREEREVKEAAIGKATLIEKAIEGNVSAAKELVNQINKTNKTGRPSKEDKEKIKQKNSKVDERVISLLDRIPHV